MSGVFHHDLLRFRVVPITSLEDPLVPEILSCCVHRNRFSYSVQGCFRIGYIPSSLLRRNMMSWMQKLASLWKVVIHLTERQVNNVERPLKHSSLSERVFEEGRHAVLLQEGHRHGDPNNILCR